MIIKSITLNNIRSYVNEKIEFNEGSTLLSGDIGSGKTSILLALEFALFGIKRVELSANSLLRNGSTTGSVELILKIQDKEIIIKRTLKKTKDAIKQDQNYIVIDNKKTDLTPVELKSKIYSLLGYPLNLISKSKDYLFRFTVYTPQEDMKKILTETSETRLETLRKLFNIDKYKRINENSSIYIKHLKNKKNQLSVEVKDLVNKINELKENEIKIDKINEHISIKELNKIKQQLKEIETEIKIKEDKIKYLDNLISSSNLLKEKINDKNISLKNLNDKKTIIVKEIDDLNNKINIDKRELREETLVRKEIETINNEYKNLISEKKIIEDKIINLQNDINKKSKLFDENLNIKLENKEEELKNNLNSVKELPHLEKNLEQLNKERENHLIHLYEFKNKIKHSQKIIDEIKEVDKCPLCLQNIDHEHKTEILNLSTKIINESEIKDKSINENINKKDNEIKDVKQKINELNKIKNSIEILNSEIKNIKENLNKNNIIKKEIDEDNKNLNLFKDKLNSIKNIETFEEKLNKLNKELNEILEYKKILDKINLYKNTKEIKEKELTNINEEINKTNEEINTLNIRLKNLNDKIEENKNIKNEFNELKNKLNDLIKKEKEIEINNAKLISEKDILIKLNDKLKKEIKEKEEINKQIDKINNLQNWIEEYFIPTINIIEKNVFSTIYIEFNEIFERWLSFLISEENLSARLNDDFTPIINQNGYDNEFDNLSGGEKQSVSLAYRLALNHVLNTLIQNINTKDILILDEPTDGFSYDQLDNIRNILEEINIKQIIIVSHEPKIESFVDNVIKVNKEDHTSKIIN